MIRNILETQALTAPLMTQEQQAPATQTTNPVVNGSLADALSSLAALISELQGKIAQEMGARASMNNELSDAQITLAIANANDIQKQIQEQQEAQDHKSFWQKLTDWVEIAVGAICCAFGLVSIGITLMVLGVADLTGIMDKISQGISTVLQKMGIPANVANLLSQAIIFVAVTMLSAGASSMTMEANLSNLFKGIAAAGAGLSMAPQLFSDAAVLVLENMPNVSEDEKKHIEMILSIVQMVLGTLMALGGGVGSARFATAVENTASAVEKEKSMIESLKEMFKSLDDKNVNMFTTQGQVAFDTASQVFNAAQSTNQAIYFDKLAKTEEKMANDQGLAEILAITMKDTQDLATQETKSFQTRLKAQSNAIGKIINAIEVEGQSFVQAISA